MRSKGNAGAALVLAFAGILIASVAFLPPTITESPYYDLWLVLIALIVFVLFLAARRGGDKGGRWG